MSLRKNQQGQCLSFKVSNVVKLSRQKNSRATKAIRLNNFIPNVEIRFGAYRGIRCGEEQKAACNLGKNVHGIKPHWQWHRQVQAFYIQSATL